MGKEGKFVSGRKELGEQLFQGTFKENWEPDNGFEYLESDIKASKTGVITVHMVEDGQRTHKDETRFNCELCNHLELEKKLPPCGDHRHGMGTNCHRKWIVENKGSCP